MKDGPVFLEITNFHR